MAALSSLTDPATPHRSLPLLYPREPERGAGVGEVSGGPPAGFPVGPDLDFSIRRTPLAPIAKSPRPSPATVALGRASR